MKKKLIIGIVVFVISIWSFVWYKFFNQQKLIYIVYWWEKWDKSYTDWFYEGVYQAQKDMKFNKKEFSFQNVEPINKCLINNICEYWKPDLVIVISDSQRDLVKKRIDNNPKIDFMLLDTLFKYPWKVKSIELSTYDASKQAWILAAKFSKTNKIGVMLWKDTEFLKWFENGYIDGAKQGKPDIELQVEYLWTWDNAYQDPDKWSQVAKKLFDNWVDIIFVVAWKSGIWAIQQAKNYPNSYIIGVDQDQSFLWPNIVIASVVKSLDTIIYDEIKMYLNKNFQKKDYKLDDYAKLIFNPKFEYLK